MYELQIFSPILGLSFHFFERILWCTKDFNIKYSLSIFSFTACACGVVLKLYYQFQGLRVSWFCSYTVDPLIFVNGMIWWSSSILLPVEIHLSQNHLLKILFLFHWANLVSLSNSVCHTYMGLFLDSQKKTQMCFMSSRLSSAFCLCLILMIVFKYVTTVSLWVY